MSHQNLIMSVCQMNFDTVGQRRRIKTTIAPLIDKNDVARD